MFSFQINFDDSCTAGEEYFIDKLIHLIWLRPLFKNHSILKSKKAFLGNQNSFYLWNLYYHGDSETCLKLLE